MKIPTLPEPVVSFQPEIGLILGSGLGFFADDRIEVAGRLPYGEIEGFPVSTVEGHAGQFVYGTVEGKRVICMQGRFHFYEGYSMAEVTSPIRLIHALGVRTLYVTNAAGGIHPDYESGDFMLLRDHINALGTNPLVGWQGNEGVRFPDMSQVYDGELLGRVRRRQFKPSLMRVSNQAKLPWISQVRNPRLHHRFRAIERHRAGIRRLASQVLFKDLREVVAGIRRAAGQHLVQEATKRVKVQFAGHHLVARNLLGRHIRKRADHHAGGGELELTARAAVPQLGEAGGDVAAKLVEDQVGAVRGQQAAPAHRAGPDPHAVAQRKDGRGLLERPWAHDQHVARVGARRDGGYLQAGGGHAGKVLERVHDVDRLLIEAMFEKMPPSRAEAIERALVLSYDAWGNVARFAAVSVEFDPEADVDAVSAQAEAHFRELASELESARRSIR